MKFKNITPLQITLFISVAISIIVVAVLAGLIFLFGPQKVGWVLLLLFIFTFLASYVIILQVLRKFIFRKIKLIYKRIHDFRVNKLNKPNEQEINLDSNIFMNVEADVKEWSEFKQKEIDQLRTLENYRREFIGNVSHELKTPIFNIQGYLHTLLDGGIHDDAINERYLEKATQNLDRLITIVEDLDIITRLESGDVNMEKIKFDLHQLVEKVFEDLELFAKEKDITLRFKVGASQNFTVFADQQSIRTVMMNLITNSVKYGCDGGETSVGFYDMDHHILVEVSDDGIGIEQKHLPHLFDRFYRVDKGRSRSDGGSGLGLAIVKHILEAHKQPIHVRSTPGVGATFSFTLPKEA